MEKQDWRMQWSSEVFPEAGMVPDPDVFVQSGAQALIRVPEIIPARLRLPFLLSRSGEHSMLATEQRGAPEGRVQQ